MVATGLVEGNGANGRLPKGLKELQGVTTVMTDHDLFVQESEPDPSLLLVCGVRLLSRPSVLNYVDGLGQGSRAAVVGAGESGVKAAIELLEFNPSLSVDLYASQTIGPYQTQVPSNSIVDLVVQENYENQALTEKANQMASAPGAPVTIDSWRKLVDFESSGRLRMRELGEYFEPDTVALEVNGSRIKPTDRLRDLWSRPSGSTGHRVTRGEYGGGGRRLQQ